jgi:mRNA interferase YafQ
LLKIKYKKAFEKDTKLAQKRGKDLNKLKEIIRLLVSEQSLPAKNRDHPLRGNYAHHRECHIEPNWLLIYKKEDDTLILERLGTHSDLFNT